jgi:hypothetical protein
VSDLLPAIRGQKISDAVEARLNTLTGVTVYRSEVATTPPTVANSGGRVAPYVVLYPAATTPTDDLDLADTTSDCSYAMQLTCVAGYSPDCEYLVDRVQALIFRWAPTVAGVAFASFRPPVGYQSGPVRRDQDVSPPRFWVPLQFVIPATT